MDHFINHIITTTVRKEVNSFISLFLFNKIYKLSLKYNSLVQTFVYLQTLLLKNVSETKEQSHY